MRRPSISALRARLLGNPARQKDPEAIITDALRQMKDAQIRNRELAVTAITEKNTFENLAAAERSRVLELLWAERTALRSGDTDDAARVRKNRREAHNRLRRFRASLRLASQRADHAKEFIRAEEARLRVAAGRALAMKGLLASDAAESSLRRYEQEVNSMYGPWSRVAVPSRTAVLLHVQLALYELFGVSHERAVLDARLRADLSLDDAGISSLCLVIAAEFAISITLDDAIRVRTVGDIVFLVHTIIRSQEPAPETS